MKNAKVGAITFFLNAIAALIRARYGDAGAIANAEQAVKNLQAADPDFYDPEFEDACNEVAGAASLRVIIAGQIPGNEASRVKRPQPSIPLGSTTAVTQIEPLPDGTQHGDLTAKKSGLV